MLVGLAGCSHLLAAPPYMSSPHGPPQGLLAHPRVPKSSAAFGVKWKSPRNGHLGPWGPKSSATVGLATILYRVASGDLHMGDPPCMGQYGLQDHGPKAIPGAWHVFHNHTESIPFGQHTNTSLMSTATSPLRHLAQSHLARFTKAKLLRRSMHHLQALNTSHFIFNFNWYLQSIYFSTF